MNATVYIEFQPRNAVPDEQAERVAWLERFGPQPDKATFSIEAPIATWARVMHVSADGTVGDQIDGKQRFRDSAYSGYRPIRDALAARAVAIVRETGVVPESLPASVLEEIAAEWAAATALRRAEIRQAEAKQAEIRQAEAKQAEIRRAAVEAEEAESAKRKAACVAALREMAGRDDELARAAAEGYPVENRMLSILAERMRANVEARLPPPAFFAIEDYLRSVEPEHIRAAPNAAAFRLLDACVAAARESELPTAVGMWEVSKILRLDVCPHKKQRNWVTAVLVTLDTPCGDRQITVSTDELACHHAAAVRDWTESNDDTDNDE